VIAGVITTLNQEQADERSGDGPLNRGVEAGLVALEMAALRRARGWVE
jgi:6,7-dimethyl-8-ribityllumazine synthase